MKETSLKNILVSMTSIVFLSVALLVWNDGAVAQPPPGCAGACSIGPADGSCAVVWSNEYQLWGCGCLFSTPMGPIMLPHEDCEFD